ncbi:hypothetical protein BIW11_07696 [Tropilaelaps mercedesae]|uniref:Uncharacterized protein n=1 Tax=Tropilaelaps mercedesae TaxID=418985 RepID=A0A1V9XT38_9ACAR|nr:hypothetical protein BIW11_07696 [Tropilaelaps mercedesae]
MKQLISSVLGSHNLLTPAAMFKSFIFLLAVCAVVAFVAVQPSAGQVIHSGYYPHAYSYGFGYPYATYAGYAYAPYNGYYYTTYGYPLKK